MGSKLGWVLAGLLVLGVAGFLAMVVLAPPRSSPTSATLRPGALELADVDISPATVTGIEPAGEGNAGDDYAQAAELVKQNMQAAAEAMTHAGHITEGNYSIDPGVLETLRKVDSLLAAGAAKARMQYVLFHGPKELEVAYYFKEVTDLQNVHRAMELLARYHFGRKEYDQAVKVLEHDFMMGWHMMKERALPDMVQRGIGIQQAALGMLASVHRTRGGVSERANAIQPYNVALKSVSSHYADKVRIPWSTRPQPGDVTLMAEKDKDRAWRVQGLLGLGIVKFTAPKRGDVKYIEKLLDKVVAKGDPIEAAAARAARDLTETQFNQLGTKGL